VSSARELRSQLRAWRRGRADVSVWQAASDAYIVVFAILVVGSMGVSAIVHAGRVAADCSTPGCVEARAALPYLVMLGWLCLVLAVVGLLGPLVVSAAASSWLYSTPVDRAALLRPQLLGGIAGTGLTGGSVLTAVAVVCGWPVTPAVLLGLVSGALAAVGYAASVVGQARRSGRPEAADPVRNAVIALLGIMLVTGTVALAAGLGGRVSPLSGAVGMVVALLSAGALSALGTVAHRRLRTIHRRTLAEGEGLASGLAGALATLDLALAYDVVMARTTRTPAGPRLWGRSMLVLAAADLARLRRSRGRVLVLLGAVPVGYALPELGVGALVVPLTMVVDAAVALPLLTALRVVATSPGLARALGLDDVRLRLGTLAVPAVVLVLLGLAAAPALPGGALTGLAVGLGATAAATRWVTGRPPDYGRPLVSTPMGGVPTNLYGSLARGFDIVLLVSIPLLFSHEPRVAVASMVLSGIVLGVLVSRR